MDIPLGQSMPRSIMEQIRIELKDKEKTREFFDIARKAVKKNMEDTKKHRPLSNDGELLLFVSLLMQNETLRRIDDFEMAHLNMIDIREECCDKSNKNTLYNKSNLSTLAQEYIKPMLETIRITVSAFTNIHP